MFWARFLMFYPMAERLDRDWLLPRDGNVCGGEREFGCRNGSTLDWGIWSLDWKRESSNSRKKVATLDKGRRKVIKRRNYHSMFFKNRYNQGHFKSKKNTFLFVGFFDELSLSLATQARHEPEPSLSLGFMWWARAELGKARLSSAHWHP